MIPFSKFFDLFVEEKDTVRIYNSVVRIPLDKPYGFWMNRHGNFAIVNGGMGAHEDIGEKILKELGVPVRRSVYDTLFSLGWIRIVLRGKTYYEAGIAQRLVPIQKRNLEFINDYYELGGVEEG